MLTPAKRAAVALLVVWGLALVLTSFLGVNFSEAQTQPAWSLSVLPSTIQERNGTSTITVAITNGATFSGDETIELTFAGTAGAGDVNVEDSTNNLLTSPYQLTLPAGQTSVTATVTPTNDNVYEAAETIVVTASYGGATIGSSQTITVTDESDRARVTAMHRLGDLHLAVDVVELWPFQVRIIFDRNVRGLVPDDLAVTNGYVLSVTGQSRMVYDLSIQPTGDEGEEVRVHVPENVVNEGNAPSTEAVDYRGTIAGRDAELISMTPSATQPVSDTFSVVLTFDGEICWEGVSFSEGLICERYRLDQHLQPTDITVTGGSLTALTGANSFIIPDDEIRVVIAPDGDFEGTLIVILPEHVASTPDGGRTGGGRLEVDVDTRGPELLSASVVGDKLTLSYHEVVATAPSASAFSVEVNGAVVNVTTVRLSGAALELTLAEPVTSGQEVLVSYTQQGARIKDSYGNLASGETGVEAETGTASKAPEVSSAEIREDVLTLGYDEPLHFSRQPTPGNFTVTVDGGNVPVSSAASSGATLQLTLQNEVQAGQVVLLSYMTTSGTTLVQDVDGVAAPQFSALAVTNNTPATVPALQSASALGNSLLMSYSEALDEGSTPTAADFTVTIDGVQVAVNSVQVSGTDVTLELARTVVVNEGIRLDYTPGASPIQDIGGTAAAALDDWEVSNATPDPGPVLVSAVLNDDDLTLTYSEPLDTTSVPDKGDFHVQYAGFGSGTVIDSVAVSGTTVVLALATGVPLPNTRVELDYTPGTDPIQDAAGNPAAALVDQEVAADTVPVRVTFVQRRVTVNEGSPTVITVTLDKDPERSLVIPLTVSLGSDATTSDYSGVPASLTFSSGQTGRNFTFTATDETETENPEIVDIEFGTLPDWVSRGRQSTSRITIADNDPPAKVTGVSVTEENARLQVDWVPVSYATGYKVQWKSTSESFVDASADNREAIISAGSKTTYTITGLTNGTRYTVRVIATKDNSPDGVASDEVRGTPMFSNTPPTGRPTISGMPEVGERLTASVSEIMDGDGLTNAIFSYQWIQVDGLTETDITSAARATYVLQSTDEGKKIRVRVTFEDDNSTQEMLTSPAFPTSGSIAPASLSLIRLVSNTTANISSQGDNWIGAQAFRTGSNPGGYTLSTVSVRLSSVANVDPGVSYASIRENSTADPGGTLSKVPGLLLARLSTPDTLSGGDALNRFAAPVNTHLRPNRTYWLTFNEEAGDDGPIPSRTTADREDSGSLAGWTIDDQSLQKGDLETTYWSISGFLLMLLVEGYENADATLDTLTLTDPDDPNVGFDIDPSYDASITSYTATVANDVDSVKLAATPNDADASVVIAPDDDANSPEEAELDLAVGSNILSAIVTAVDDVTTKTYTIVVTRLDTSPGQVRYVTVTPGDSRLAVEWNSVLGATGYRVQWKTGSKTFVDAADGGREAIVAAGQVTRIGHTITGLDNGAEYTVRVIAIKTGAYDGSPSDEVTGTPNNTAPTGKPTISGTPTVGQTLTADTSSIMDADGLTGFAYQYQWVRVDGATETDIPGATGVTYELRVPDTSKKVKVRVTFDDDASKEETLTSDAFPGAGTIAGVSVPANTPATGKPAITGTAKVGQTLTASPGNIADANGLTNPSYVYQWILDDSGSDTEIAGATGSTYRLTSNESGKKVKVKATFVDGAGYEEVRTSDAYPSGTDTVAAASSDATLSGFRFEKPSLDPNLKEVTLTPVFSAGTTDYAGNVGGMYATVAMYASFNNEFATLEFHPSGSTNVFTALPQTIKRELDLAPGENELWVVVTAEDGVTSQTYTATITRGLPQLSFASLEPNLNEGVGTANIAVVIEAVANATVTVDYATRDVSAKAGADYTNKSGTLTFGPKDSSQSITVPVNDDDVYEADELFRIYLDSPTNAQLPSSEYFATATLLDNDDVPAVTLDDVSVAESSGTITLTLQLSHPSVFDIRYRLADANVSGTATDSADYRYDRNATATSAEIKVPAGELSKTFEISLVDDELAEDDETIIMRWNRVEPGATPGFLDFTGTITNDDDPRRLVVSKTLLSIAESGSDTFTVKLATQPTHEVTVAVSSDDTGAAIVSDSSLIFTTSDWNTEQTVTVSGANDPDIIDESLTVSLMARSDDAGYQGKTASVSVSVSDDDTPSLVLSRTDLNVSENESETFTVRLGSQLTGTVGLIVTSSDPGVATVSPQGRLITAAQWNQERTFTVTGVVDADTVDETVSVTLSASGGDYAGVEGSMTVTVNDNDTVQVTGVAVASGDGELVVSWTRVANATGYRVQWKSGVQPYNTGDRQYAVAGGSTTSHTITGLANGAEYTVRVSAVRTGANDGPPSAEATGTPAEPTAPGVSVSKTMLTVTEAGTGTFTVKLATQPTGDVTVSVSSGDTAAATVSPASLTFTTSDWDIAQTVTVSGVNDADAADEGVAVSLSASGGGYAGVSGSVSVTVTDDDTAPGVDYVGDTTETAGAIEVGESWLNGNPVKGRVEQVYDADWYRTELKGGHCYQIEIRGKGHTEHGHVEGLTLSDPLLRGVYTERGNYMAGTQDDDSGGHLAALKTVKIDVTSVVYISVTHGWYNEGGTFDLSLIDLGTVTKTCTDIDPSVTDAEASTSSEASERRPEPVGKDFPRVNSKHR